MALCAVAGAIYAYLYFTRINPITKGHRWAVRVARHATDARQPVVVNKDEEGGPSTHIFLFRNLPAAV